MSEDIVHHVTGLEYRCLKVIPGSDSRALLDDLLGRVNEGVLFDSALIIPGTGLHLFLPAEGNSLSGIYYPDVQCYDDSSIYTAASIIFYAGAATAFSCEEIAQKILDVSIHPDYQYLRVRDMGSSGCRFSPSGSYSMKY